MIPEQAIIAAREAMREVTPPPGVSKADWLAEHGDFALIAGAIAAAAPHTHTTVTSRVEQVNLPNETVIVSAEGEILQHFNGYWFAPGSSYRHHIDEVALPAQVLYTPNPYRSQA